MGASKIINKDKSNSPKRIKSEPTVTVRIDTSPKSRERKLQRKSRSRSRSPSPKLKKSVKDRLGDKLSSTEAAEADPPTFKSSHWGSKSRLGEEQRNGRSSPKNSKSMKADSRESKTKSHRDVKVESRSSSRHH